MNNARLFKIKKAKYLKLEQEFDLTIKEKNYERLREFTVNQIDKNIAVYDVHGKYEIDQIIITLIRTLVLIESTRRNKEC